MSILTEKLTSDEELELKLDVIPGQTIVESKLRLICGTVPTLILASSESGSHPSWLTVMETVFPPELLKIFSKFCDEGDSETDYSGISKKIGGDAWDYPFDPKGSD